MGFRSPLSAMLDHVDADFTIYEEVGKVSMEACRLIKRALGKDYITLADLPKIPFEKMNKEDRCTLTKAFHNLKPDDRLKLERRGCS